MTVFNCVRQVIADQVFVALADITPESRLKEDLGADSLDLVEIIIGVEDLCGIPEIPDKKAWSFKTVQDFVDYVTEEQRKAA